jgi:hypothetical protein
MLNAGNAISLSFSGWAAANPEKASPFDMMVKPTGASYWGFQSASRLVRVWNRRLVDGMPGDDKTLEVGYSRREFVISGHNRRGPQEFRRYFDEKR